MSERSQATSQRWQKNNINKIYSKCPRCHHDKAFSYMNRELIKCSRCKHEYLKDNRPICPDCGSHNIEIIKQKKEVVRYDSEV